MVRASLEGPLIPYSTFVWIAILTSLVIQILYGTFIRKVELRLKLLLEFPTFRVRLFMRSRFINRDTLFRLYGTILDIK